MAVLLTSSLISLLILEFGMWMYFLSTMTYTLYYTYLFSGRSAARSGARLGAGGPGQAVHAADRDSEGIP